MSKELLPPNEETVSIDTYSKWVFKTWVKVMGSGELTVIGLIWAWTRFDITYLPVLLLLYVIVFGVTLYVATYDIWKVERLDKLSIIETASASEHFLRNKALEIETGLALHITENQRLELINENLTKAVEVDKRPKIIGFFQELTYFAIHASSERGDARRMIETGTRFVVRVGFVNESPIPTTIHGFRLIIKTTQETFSAVQIENVNKFNNGDLSVRSGNNFILFGLTPQNSDDFLIHMLDSKKCEKGEQISGTLAFDYGQGFDDLVIQSYQLDIKDAWGQSHSIIKWGNAPRPSKRILNS